MLPSWNRPKFKCPPITVNQSQFLFISNFNREIMQSVPLFICSVGILRNGCQPRFIQFGMLSTGYPTLSSVALIIRTVACISRLQVSVCLQLSPFPLSVCLSVRHFIVKKSCDTEYFYRLWNIFAVFICFEAKKYQLSRSYHATPYEIVETWVYKSLDSDSVTRIRCEYAFMVHSGQCTTKHKISSTRICKKGI